MVSGYLEYVSDLIVKDSSLHLSLPGEGIDLSATGVNLKAAGTDKTTIGLNVTRLDFRNDKPNVTFTAGLRCEATWPRAEPFSLEGNLELDGLFHFSSRKAMGGAEFQPEDRFSGRRAERRRLRVSL